MASRNKKRTFNVVVKREYARKRHIYLRAAIVRKKTMYPPTIPHDSVGYWQQCLAELRKEYYGGRMQRLYDKSVDKYYGGRHGKKATE